MGQSCGCVDSEQQSKLKAMEQLYASRKDEYQRLQANYDKINKETKELQRNNAQSSAKIKKQIQTLESEKQQAWKEMMKEKKRITKLENAKSELENKKRNMEKQISDYKRQISKFDSNSNRHVRDDSITSKDSFITVESIAVRDMERSPSHSFSATPAPIDFSKYDIEADMDRINACMDRHTGDKRKDKKHFKTEMTDLFTARPRQYSLKIVQSWREKYGNDLLKQIEIKLDGQTKGVPFRVLSGLLQSSADIDCRWIHECDMQIDKVAHVICARTVDEIIEIKRFWKKEYGSSMVEMLHKLAKHHHKNTMAHMFENLCNTEQRLSKGKIKTFELIKNVDWMILSNKYKHSDKEKMCKLVTINSNEYVQRLVSEYNSKNKSNLNIGTYLDKKYGTKSMVGSHLKAHIMFIENGLAYFAQKIYELCETKDKFKRNNLEILNIFLSRFQIDLCAIAKEFQVIKGRELRNFVLDIGAGHNSVYFLVKILDNSMKFE